MSATDADSTDSVTLLIGTGVLPLGAAFDPSTGAFSWTSSTFEGSQLFTVNFVAQDNGSPQLSDTETVKIGVGAYPSPSTATDPNNDDTDGDGFSDLVEIAAGSDPLDPNSIP